MKAQIWALAVAGGLLVSLTSGCGGPSVNDQPPAGNAAFNGPGGGAPPTGIGGGAPPGMGGVNGPGGGPGGANAPR